MVGRRLVSGKWTFWINLGQLLFFREWFERQDIYNQIMYQLINFHWVFFRLWHYIWTVMVCNRFINLSELINFCSSLNCQKPISFLLISGGIEVKTKFGDYPLRKELRNFYSCIICLTFCLEYFIELCKNYTTR